MRQEQFIARHQAEWDAFEQWLQLRGERTRVTRRQAPAVQAEASPLADDEVPAAYRRLCNQLSLARRRNYSAALLDRLQGLMQRGHAVLYRPSRLHVHAIVHFLGRRFPALVRAEWRCMLASLLLFAVPLVATFTAILLRPELAYGLFPPEQLAEFERMYDPAAEHTRLGRDSGGDVAMFGHYVFNNISIGFRTFASGLLACFGTLVVLLFNGLVIGGVAGHLQAAGYGDPFWRFVCGHGAFELTAIVIAGGAGLQLGLHLLLPGNRRRRDALVHAGRRGGLLCAGVFAMLVAAAFVEAFWSSIGWMPAWIKYAVAAVLWLGVGLWLWRGGWGDPDAA